MVTLDWRATGAMADRASMVPMVSMEPRLVKPAALVTTDLQGVLGVRAELAELAELEYPMADVMATTQTAATVAPVE